jgi:hypothetical protein
MPDDRDWLEKALRDAYAAGASAANNRSLVNAAEYAAHTRKKLASHVAGRLETAGRAIDACAEYLKDRGIPCGVWKVPPPSEVEAAQSAFDAELERIIDDMKPEAFRRLSDRT